MCPNGVEWKTLGKLCEINKGEQLNKENMSEVGSYPVINGGICPSGYVEVYNQPKDTITISQGGASAGYVNWMKTEFWAGAHCYVVIPNKEIVSNRYVYHYVKSIESKLQECQYGAGIPALAKKTVEQVQIPLPPLAIQSRIGEILDHFTNLTANLTAELALRRKQFEHFREKMLCPNGVEWKTLGEVGTFFNGVTGKSKKDFENGNAKFISYMNVFTNPKLNIDVNDTIQINEGEKQNTLQYGDAIFTTSSETPDESGMSAVLTTQSDEKLYLNSFCFGFRFNSLENINPDFYSYIFRSEPLRKQIVKCANGVTRYNISKESFAKVKIPVPPLAVQQTIVEQLDKFTALIQNLENELALRQKQYEYYREKLLSFPSPSL